MSGAAELAGLRVFVAEDEVLLVMLLEDMLADLECEIVGPFTSLSAALEGADAGGFDVALVDMNLGSDKADPLVERLRARGKPYAIASGGNADGHPVVLGKPYGFDELQRILETLKSGTAG